VLGRLVRIANTLSLETLVQPSGLVSEYLHRLHSLAVILKKDTPRANSDNQTHNCLIRVYKQCACLKHTGCITAIT
jgi:hypothetical protein